MDVHQNPQHWKQLLDQIKATSGMTATLYDHKGVVIRRSGELSNDLCRLVQAHASAVATICSVAQQSLGQEALVSGEPVVGECDLGMVKYVVPVFKEDEVVGFIGACGAREPDVEVESFLAGKALDMEQEALADAMATINTITPEVIGRTIQIIQKGLMGS